MTICHTKGCPTSRPFDEFGRRTSVLNVGVSQPMLGATGHHLVNRHIKGTLPEHLRGWRPDQLWLAHEDVAEEVARVRAYLALLSATLNAIDQEYTWASTHPAPPPSP